MHDKPIIRFLIWLLYAIFGIVALYLFFKFIFPWTAPFILAFITAACFEPIVNAAFERYRIKRWLTSAALTALLLILLFLLGQTIVTKCFSALTDFLTELPEKLSGISIGWFDRRVSDYISSAPVNVRDYLAKAIAGVVTKLQELPGELSGTALLYLTQLVTHMPKIFLFIATYAVGVFFISSCYPEVKDFIMRQLPGHYESIVTRIKSGILSTFTKWLQAQLMLMGVTFLELTAGFLLLGIEHPLIIAGLTALIDALPILGVGTVLLPWAVFQLISGQTTLAVGLAVMYGAITIIRSLLEPKFVGAKLGLHPVATLLAMYIGFSSIGVSGMILFPIGLIIIKQLNDDHIISVWK